MKLKTSKTLQYNFTHTFDINSSNRMFCSILNFTSKTLFTSSFALTLMVRIHDTPKLSRNKKGYLISQNRNSHVNCLITCMFTGLEHEKKDKVLVP